MSPSARMTATSGIARQLATWPSCARSPSTSWAGTEHPGSVCGRGASRPPGTMITCSLFWLDDFMRRPWDLHEFGETFLREIPLCRHAEVDKIDAQLSALGEFRIVPGAADVLAAQVDDRFDAVAFLIVGD